MYKYMSYTIEQQLGHMTALLCNSIQGMGYIVKDVKIAPQIEFSCVSEPFREEYQRASMNLELTKLWLTNQ